MTTVLAVTLAALSPAAPAVAQADATTVEGRGADLVVTGDMTQPAHGLRAPCAGTRRARSS